VAVAVAVAMTVAIAAAMTVAAAVITYKQDLNTLV
jgi:hypothetical protein